MSKLDDLIRRINSDVGREVASRASDDGSHFRVPTGLPTLDHSIGGGVARGLPVMLQGMPSSGKSSLAYKLAGQAAKILDLPAVVIHSEGPFGIHQDWAKKCGLPDMNLIVETGVLEEALDLVYDLAASASVSAIIVDSMTSLKPKASLELKAADRESFGGKAVILNRFFNKIVNRCAKPYPLLLFTTHLYQKPSPKGGTIWFVSGGMDQEYMPGLILRLQKADVGERTLKLAGKNTASDVSYLEVGWRVEKTKVGGRYHDTGGYRLYLADDIYPSGTITDAAQAAAMGIAIGLVEQRGAWFTYKGEKYQGIDALLPKLDIGECVNAYVEECRRQRACLRGADGEGPAAVVPEDDVPPGGGKRGRSAKGRRGVRQGLDPVQDGGEDGLGEGERPAEGGD